MLVPVMKPSVGKQFCLCSPADPASLFISWGAIFNTEYGSVVGTLSSGGGLKTVALAARSAAIVPIRSQRLSDAGRVKSYLFGWLYILRPRQYLTLSLLSALFLFLGVPQWQPVGRLWG